MTNLYGPGDSYNPDRSHVVAALVRKWVEADLAAAPSIEVWGTGKPIREFIYVEDCADAIVLAAEKYHDVNLPLNIGTGIGTSIRELVETINEVTGFKGKIAWNTDKPDGAIKKVLDVTRMKAELEGWSPPTSLATGWPRRSPGTGPTRPRRTRNGDAQVLVSRRSEADSTQLRSGARPVAGSSALGLDDGVDPRSLSPDPDADGDRTSRRDAAAGESSSSTSITGPTRPRPRST